MGTEISNAQGGAAPNAAPDAVAGALAQASVDDVFLSPHSDDVCFSLGVQAATRRRGTLLTVFPVSAYSAATPQGDPAHSAAVTLRRLEEDAAFARAAGLQACCLPFKDSLMRGQAPFNPRPAAELAGHIEARLFQSLMGPMIGRRSGRPPWLFCPAAVGGHVDHLAVLLAVLKHRSLLGRHYRLAFYEDLHYASDPVRRERGLANLQHLLGDARLHRVAWPLDAAQQAAKLRLVRLHASQPTPQINTLAAYTPALGSGGAPHEAAWVLQSA